MIARLLDRLAGLDPHSALALVRDTADRLVGSDAAVAILLLATIGAATVAGFATTVLVRGLRRLFVRPRPAPDRTERVQGLARLGARPAEIARAVGLPRDAIPIVAPAAAATGTKVPPAARSAAPERLANRGERYLPSHITG